ncbi:pentapeptide repeat-containing protein [Sedimentitalea sp. HM32M-2]
MPDHSQTQVLKRISTVTKVARTTWFTYLITLAFVTVTLLDVEDVDFFALDRGAELPLIGVSVPVPLFFLFGAGIVTAVNIYIHVFLEKLWRGLAQLPSCIDDQRVASQIEPWLVSEFALHVRRWRRPDEPPCIESSPLGILGVVASATLLYIAGPALLVSLWYRSQPAHDWLLTLPISVMLTFAIWTTWTSLSALRERMDPGEHPKSGFLRIRPVATVVLAVAVMTVSLLRTTWDVAEAGTPRYPEDSSPLGAILNWFRPVPANLFEARLTSLPPDWRDRDTARQRFYSEWCDRPGQAECEADLAWPDRFEREWRALRADYLAALPKPSLQGRDLAFANLAGVFAPGIDLRGANLSGARLDEAVLEGANLSILELGSGDSRHTLLRGVTLNRTDLTAVDLSGAVLHGAEMNNTVLREATLEDVDLRASWLLRPDVSGARLIGIDLRYSAVIGANIPARCESYLGEAFNSRTLRHVMERNEISQTILPYCATENLKALRTFHDVDLAMAALRFLDLKFLGSGMASNQVEIAGAFADRSVDLPSWRKDYLPSIAPGRNSDRCFFGRWRALIEARRLPWPPSAAIGNQMIVASVKWSRSPFHGGVATVSNGKVADVPPILPDEECTKSYQSN